MAKIIEQKNFPYVFARVSAMKSKLVSKDDYTKMLKMDLTSITRYLQESEYKTSITSLSTQYHGMELVDRALRQNQESTYDKLRMISPNDVVEVIDLFLVRSDFQNLKVVLRGIYSKSSKESVLSLLEPIGKFDRRHFEDMFETGSVWKALLASKIVSEKDIKPVYDEFKEKGRLIELENKLDNIYFKQSIKGAAKLKRHGTAFRQFLLREIDIINIKNLLRFKNEGLTPERIMAHMIVHGLKLNKQDLEELASKDSIGSIYSVLNKTYYGDKIDFEGEIDKVELQLKSFHLKNASLKSRQKPLSILTILGYMLSKLIEIRNLRSLVKSKHLGIDMDFVEKNLIVV